jgi:hypothetical protein
MGKKKKGIATADAVALLKEGPLDSSRRMSALTAELLPTISTQALSDLMPSIQIQTLSDAATKWLHDQQLPQSVRHAELVASLEHPQTKAWLRLPQALAAIRLDPEVAVNPVAVQLIELFELLAENAYGHWTLDQVLQPVADHMKSRHASEVASSKNASVRAWALDEWNGRTDKTQSKAAFAREYVNKIVDRFGVKVDANTISRDWLPKVK